MVKGDFIIYSKLRFRQPRSLITLLSIAALAIFPAFGQASETKGAPVAIVENYSGSSTSIQFLDYLRAGQNFKISANDQLILGYLQSCIKETIQGGEITIGQNMSSVKGGKVSRERVECDGGRLQNMTSKNAASAVTVFREKPNEGARRARPKITIYSTRPFISLSSKNISIEIQRLDKKEKPKNLGVENSTSDLAKYNIQLIPGGIYRIVAGKKSLVFLVDPLAKDKSLSLLQRLLQL